jgi:Glutathione S-transferase, N-terminal domain
MRIYVCWDTKASYPVIGDHPCGIAYHALLDAGHDPEAVKAYGWEKLPQAFNNTSGRREVKRLTGSNEVPVLVLDDGEVVAGSQEIVAWAGANPATAAI